jgi:hypothetical protein
LLLLFAVGPWAHGSATIPCDGGIISVAPAGCGACADANPDAAPSMAALASKSFRIVIPPAFAGP